MALYSKINIDITKMTNIKMTLHGNMRNGPHVAWPVYVYNFSLVTYLLYQITLIAISHISDVLVIQIFNTIS